ncbi:MAG: hypothetical protein K2J11_08770, partial [Oscillospiraceae bacterium]|nr:hypothetical protein [Oscillospiraceae bacterium]
NGRIKAVQQADNTEDWFRDEFNKETADFSAAEKGKLLTEAYNGLSNAESGFTGEDPELAKEIPDEEWDNFSLIQMSSDVVKKANVTSLMSVASDEETEDSIQQGIEECIEIEGADVITAETGTPADVGIKCAAAGAVYAAKKKGMLSEELSKNTSTRDISSMAVGAVETAKVCINAAAGACSAEDAVERIQRVGVARLVNMLADRAPNVCATIGGVFGPQGAAIGLAVGSAVSFLAKTEVGEFFKRGLNKIATKARKGLAKVGKKIKDGVMNFASKIKSKVKGIFA